MRTFRALSYDTPRRPRGNRNRTARRGTILRGWASILVLGLAEVDGPADRRLAELRGELVDRVAEALALGPRRLVEPELPRRIARLEGRRRDATQPHAATLARLDH